jgi:hypothetical protein
VENLVIRRATVQVGNKNLGVTEIRTDIHPGDREQSTLEGAFTGDQAGENASDRLRNAD